MASPRTPPRLTVELVPETCWYSNVRSLVSEAQWKRIRQQVYRQCSYRCEICGGKGPRHPVEAHEIWSYDDTHHLQTLAGLIGLCPACHEVKHLGFAGVRGRGQAAQEHLARVNGWTPAATEGYVRQAFQTWQQRSEHVWDLDLSGLQPYVTQQEYQAVCEHAEVERGDVDQGALEEDSGVVVIDLGPPDADRDAIEPPPPPPAHTPAQPAGTPASPRQAGARASWQPRLWTTGLLLFLATMTLLLGWWTLVLVPTAVVALVAVRA